MAGLNEKGERKRERDGQGERETGKKQFFFVKVWKRRVYSDLNKF